MFRYLENDHTCYATNLIQKSLPNGATELKWDCSPGCGIFIVRSTNGEDVSSRLDDICRKLNSEGNQSLFNDFHEIETGTYVKILDNVQNLNHTAEVTGRGRYMVFAYKENNGNIDVYPPPTGGMGSYYKDISVKVKLCIKEEMKNITKGHLFNKQELSVPSGYYSVRFPKGFNESQYKDGELFYTVQGTKIPITSVMIQQEKIYIRSDSKPEIKSINNAVEVVESYE